MRARAHERISSHTALAVTHRNEITERCYDRIIAQVEWLTDRRQIPEPAIAGALLELLRGGAVSAPFETVEERNVLGRLALLWLWRAPTRASIWFVSGPVHLERIAAGESRLVDSIKAIRDLDRCVDQPGPVELRLEDLLGIDDAQMEVLWSLDEFQLKQRLAGIREQLKTEVGAELVEEIVGRVTDQVADAITGGSTDDVATADGLIARARRRVPGSALDLGRTRLAVDPIRESIDDCGQALKLEPLNLEARVLRAHLRTLIAEQLPEARADLEFVLAREPQQGDAWCALGRVSQCEGDLRAAIAAYDRALAVEIPSRTSARVYRGVTRLEVGDLEGAESDALATISALPNNPSGYCILGTVHSRRGDFEAGLEAFGLALAVDPNYAGAFLERALLHEKLGDTARAMEDHDRAVALSAEGTAHYNRGNLRLALNDLTGAEEDFSEALRLNPKDAQALLNRGSVRALKGDVEGCAEDFEQAAKLYPQRAAARMKWGVLLLNLERKAEALSELQAALACAPEDWPHRAEIEALVSTLD